MIKKKYCRDCCRKKGKNKRSNSKMTLIPQRNYPYKCVCCFWAQVDLKC
jgi:hypothetical protein